MHSTMESKQKDHLRSLGLEERGPSLQLAHRQESKASRQKFPCQPFSAKNVRVCLLTVHLCECLVDCNRLSLAILALLLPCKALKWILGDQNLRTKLKYRGGDAEFLLISKRINTPQNRFSFRGKRKGLLVRLSGKKTAHLIFAGCRW